jgi:hypothetical protein
MDGVLFLPKLFNFPRLKDLFLKTEKTDDDKDKEKKEARPSWVDELLEAVKPKQQEEQTTPQEIPLPPAPKTEEEEEEEEAPKTNPLKKVWEFLM